MPPNPTARVTILSMLATRARGATLCPSEVARAISADKAKWRGEMPGVHAEVEQMVAEELVGLTWKGAERAVGGGPYRIKLARTSI